MDNNKNKFCEEVKDFFKYVIFDKIKTFFYNLKYYFKNLIYFQKDLWNFRSWDHVYCVNMYVSCLERLKDTINNGHVVKYTANKKVNKIQELIDLLNQYETFHDDIDEEFFNATRQYREEPIIDENGNWVFPDMSKNENVKKAREVYQKKFKQRTLEYKDKVSKILFGQSEREIIRLTRQLRKELKENNRKITNEPTDNETYNIWANVYDGSGCENWWD